MPSTTSGVDIGRKISMFVALRPEVADQGERDQGAEGRRRQRRPEPDEEAVDHGLVESPRRPSGLSQASNEFRKTRFERPVGSLKLKAIMISTGSARNATTPRV